QGNWNGVVGGIELRAAMPTWLDDLQVFPRVASKSIVIRGKVNSLPRQSTRQAVDFVLSPLSGPAGARHSSVNVAPDGTFEKTMAVGDQVQLWDEFNPALYELSAQP